MDFASIASGAVAGIGQAVGTVLGVVKGAKTQSKALGIQRDVANRTLDLQAEALRTASDQADKDRAETGAQLNTLLTFYGEQAMAARKQADAAREAGVAMAAVAGQPSGSGNSLLLVGGAVVLLLFLKRK